MASAGSESGMGLETLLQQADIGMYDKKRNKKTRATAPSLVPVTAE